MLLIQKAIDDLLESDKIHAPYGHDVRFYIPDTKESLYVSTGVSEDYPLHFYFNKKDLTPEQEKKIKQLELQHSKDKNFKDFGRVRITGEFELEKEYIENLIIQIFKEVFGYNNISELEYYINPI